MRNLIKFTVDYIFEIPPASTTMYFSPVLKTPNVELTLSFCTGRCMQNNEAASGSRVITNLSLQIEAYKI